MNFKVSCFGWIPDLPDHRDYLYAASLEVAGAPPASVDLRAQVAKTGRASLPESNEQSIGGPAVICASCDDSKQWFIVQNSWGPNWGMKGYFTLPYVYVTAANLASDFWTIRVVQ